MRHNRTVDRVAQERAGPLEDYGSRRSPRDGLPGTGQCLQHVEVERSRPVGGTSAGIVTGRVLWDARGSCDPGGSQRCRLSLGYRAVLPRGR